MNRWKIYILCNSAIFWAEISEGKFTLCEIMNSIRYCNFEIFNFFEKTSFFSLFSWWDIKTSQKADHLTIANFKRFKQMGIFLMEIRYWEMVNSLKSLLDKSILYWVWRSVVLIRMWTEHINLTCKRKSFNHVYTGILEKCSCLFK